MDEHLASHLCLANVVKLLEDTSTVFCWMTTFTHQFMISKSLDDFVEKFC